MRQLEDIGDFCAVERKDLLDGGKTSNDVLFGQDTKGGIRRSRDENAEFRGLDFFGKLRRCVHYRPVGNGRLRYFGGRKGCVLCVGKAALVWDGM